MRNERTKIEFDYNGKHYILEFTADTLKKMERGGFKFGDMDKNIVTSPEDAFYWAFTTHHADTPTKVRKEIYNALARHGEGDDSEESADGLTEYLAQMLVEAFDEIANRGNGSGNVTWKVTK